MIQLNDLYELGRVVSKLFRNGYVDTVNDNVNLSIFTQGITNILDVIGGYFKDSFIFLTDMGIHPAFVALGLVIIISIPIAIVKRSKRVPDLNTLIATRDIKGLIDVLEYNKHETSTQVEGTTDFVEVESVNLRCGAAKALGEFGHPDAVEPLIEHLTDPDRFVRMNIVQALMRFRSPRVKQALLHVSVRDVDETVRFMAENAVGAQ